MQDSMLRTVCDSFATMTSEFDLYFAGYPVILRLVLAVVLGGLIGLERQSKGHMAGLRTNILVCLGSALMMVMSEELFRQDALGDRGRVAAGIITGIGFLGAGAIVHVGNIHRGLTTAAIVWTVSAIGITAGAGLASLALAGTALALVTIVGLERLEKRMLAYERWNITVVLSGGAENLVKIEGYLLKRGFHVFVSGFHTQKTENRTELSLDLSGTGKREILALPNELRQTFDNIREVRLIR